MCVYTAAPEALPSPKNKSFLRAFFQKSAALSLQAGGRTSLAR